MSKSPPPRISATFQSQPLTHSSISPPAGDLVNHPRILQGVTGGVVVFPAEGSSTLTILRSSDYEKITEEARAKEMMDSH
ncbi:hypothetical protein Patl1_11625 [Pistacia atlantica]|uniref:Uncharacterized protein n=1 Tax=Pistacia atlantica TaxID=434234 RepID=A0ACC1A4S7_9ROSI|nr:hypothetical protein Patl1_11625 [Pistacia atlantica]